MLAWLVCSSWQLRCSRSPPALPVPGRLRSRLTARGSSTTRGARSSCGRRADQQVGGRACRCRRARLGEPARARVELDPPRHGVGVHRACARSLRRGVPRRASRRSPATAMAPRPATWSSTSTRTSGAARPATARRRGRPTRSARARTSTSPRPPGTFAANYFSPFTVCQFTRFWADADLQDALRRGAAPGRQARLGDDPRLAGLRPDERAVPGRRARPGAFEATRAVPVLRAGDGGAARAVDPDAIVFVEPANAKNVHLPTAHPARAARRRAPPTRRTSTGCGTPTTPSPSARRSSSANMALLARGGRASWACRSGTASSACAAARRTPRRRSRQIYDIADAHLAGAAVWEYARNDYGVLRADGTLDPARAADRHAGVSGRSRRRARSVRLRS